MSETELPARRRGTLELLLLAFGLVFAFVLGEVTLRVYTWISPRSLLAGLDPMGVRIEPLGPLGFRQRPGAVFRYANGAQATTNSLGYRGPEVPLVPIPGTVRIEIFGGSSTFGWSVTDSQTIDRNLLGILRERYPTRHFEVINLAFDGYDSYQDLQRLESDGLRFHPSIVILNSGLNDVRNAWHPDLHEADPRTLMWQQDLERLRTEQANGGPRLWTRIKHYSMWARLPGFLRDALDRRRESKRRLATPDGTQASTSPAPIRHDTGAPAMSQAPRPPYPDAAEFFERHVRKIVELSVAQGAAVLLSTPPSNLRNFPPDTVSAQSYWIHDAKTTADYRDELSRRMEIVAAEEAAKGLPVRHVVPKLSQDLFIDDAHLYALGNRALAMELANALAPFLAPAGQPLTPSPRADARSSNRNRPVGPAMPDGDRAIGRLRAGLGV